MEQLITGGLEKTFAVTGENKKTKIVIVVVWLLISMVFLLILNSILNDMSTSTISVSVFVIAFICIQVVIILQATQI